MARSFLALFFCVLANMAQAIPVSQAELTPADQCRAGIGAAERTHAIPAQLMAAIGRVESGRRDPGNGAWGAWPWTINAEGQGSWFPTKAEAIQAVQALQSRGVRSIDVGCMQVNLMHHPNAFASLEQAFEPAANADYAARFLAQLHDQTGDWTKATASYHSGNPEEGEPYAAKVAAVWPEEQRKAGLAPAPVTGTARNGMFARAFPARPPPGIFSMRAMPSGKMPMTMLRGAAGSPGVTRPGVTRPGVTLPGMMQGGAIPAGTLPSGYLANRLTPMGASIDGTPDKMPPAGIMFPGSMTPGMMASGSEPAPWQAAVPGHGLDFYRAVSGGTPRVGRVPQRTTFRLAGK